VVVLHRRLKENLALIERDKQQLQLSTIEVFAPGEVYEYVVRITNRSDAIEACAQLYRDRGDRENHFNESQTVRRSPLSPPQLCLPAASN